MTDDERRQCRHTIDGIRNDRPRGRQNRPWFRRSCKRLAQPGSDWCWQHDPEYVPPIPKRHWQ